MVVTSFKSLIKLFALSDAIISVSEKTLGQINSGEAPDAYKVKYMLATGFPGMIAPPSICTMFSIEGAYPTVQYNYAHNINLKHARKARRDSPSR